MHRQLLVILGLAVVLAGFVLIPRYLNNPASTPPPTPLPALATSTGPAVTPRPQPTAVGGCPRSAAEISAIAGGSATSWRPLPGNEQQAWKYGPAPSAPITDGTVTGGWKADWWDNKQAHSALGPARIPFATEATVWMACQP